MINGIKGNEMRMIHVHSPGSSMFSEAYFVVRRETAPMSDMVEEAQRIIRRYSAGEGDELRLLRPKKDSRRFILGVLTGIAVSAAFAVVISLFLR